MYQIANLTDKKDGLNGLSGKYIMAKKIEVCDALIISKYHFNGLSIPNSLFVIEFIDEPDRAMIEALSMRGIVAIRADENDLFKNLREFFENGNLINCYNFDDINIGENENTRLSFVTKNFEDPLSKILEILSVLKISAKKISTTRRDDGISYVILETTNNDLGSLAFEGEDGSNILKFRMIER